MKFFVFAAVLLLLSTLTSFSAGLPTRSQSVSEQLSVDVSRSESESQQLSVEVSRSESVTPSISEQVSGTETYYRFSNRLTCPANITAGSELACIAQVAVKGNLYGIETCMARLNVCGVNALYLSNATLRGVGLFRFTFVPTVAGRTVLTANYNGTYLGKAVVYVKPAPYELRFSSSQCAVVNATNSTTRCATLWRDRFGNVAKSCNTTFLNTDPSYSQQSVCTAL